MRLTYILLCLTFSLTAVLGSMAANAAPPSQSTETAMAAFSSDCTNSGGKIVKTLTNGVLICQQFDGFNNECDFTKTFGTSCTGMAPTNRSDHWIDRGE